MILALQLSCEQPGPGECLFVFAGTAMKAIDDDGGNTVMLMMIKWICLHYVGPAQSV